MRLCYANNPVTSDSRKFLILTAALLLPIAAGAQDGSGANPHTGMTDMSPTSMFLMNLASGTALNPASWPMPMIMRHYGHWNTQFMGLAFVSDIQQSGPRGGDKFYSTNWFMASAQHRVASRDSFQAELMVSLEPATVTDRRYPLLFQTGETAYGMPIVDAQHPHNLIMELGVHYVHQLTETAILDLYAAPVGDPALGPVAYPHRASAAELPQAPISHHWQDSTHIADDVVTLGVRYNKFKLEASGFHGAEPGENRWILQSGAIDSWSTRFWFFPARNWAAQLSVGRLAHPEALAPGDQVRATASLAYTLPMRGSAWSSSLIWGRNHNTATLRNLNSYLAETVFPVTARNLLTARAELVDKDELFANSPALEAQIDRQSGSTFRIGAYTCGYTRQFGTWFHVEPAVGANITAYSLPPAIKPQYGAHPVGGNLFVRFRLR
jgi:hypothetical protein